MSTPNARRIGPRMADAAAHVRRSPGRAVIHTAREVGPNGSLRYGYQIVARALRAGLIRSVPGPRGSALLYPAA